MTPAAAQRQQTRVSVADFREVPCLFRPRSHPGHRPGPGPGGGRRACPRVPGPPLPDPDAVRLCPVPDSAPPYDDELLPPPARTAGRGPPAVTPAGAAERDGPGRRAGPGRQAGPARARGQGPGRRAASCSPWRVGWAVRAGAGGNAGRVAATTADVELGHRPCPGPDPAPRADARSRPEAPAAPGGGLPARVRRHRDDCGRELRAPGPGPGHPPGARPATPGPAWPSAPQIPMAVHRSRGRVTGLPGRPGPGSGPARSRLCPPTRRRGYGDRRGSACTCAPTRRGTGRCGRPG